MRILTTLYVLVLFANSVLAQSNKLIVIPMFSQEESPCLAIKKDLRFYKAPITEIEKVLKERGQTITSFRTVFNRIQAKGCPETSSEFFTKATQNAQASLYIISEVDYQTSSTGNFVNLSLAIHDAVSQQEVAYFTMKSNKMYSTNVAALTKQAFKRGVSDLLEEVEGYTGSMPLADNQVDNKVVLESDVDINIPSTLKVNEDAIAVIIGNRDYEHADVPSVDFALHDARIMKKYLLKAYGFKEENIIYEENASLATFNALFGTEKNPKGKLYNYIKPNKSDVFVFYSGHGAPNPETNEGYFVPVNTDPSLIQHNGYSLSTFYSNLGALPYRTITVLVDACFSGSSDGGMLLKNISPVFIRTKNKILNDEKAMVFSSASSNQVSSWYPEKKHSLFTYFFLKGIQGNADSNHDGNITLEEITAYLQENVTYMARRLNNREQTPQISGVTTKVVYGTDKGN